MFWTVWDFLQKPLAWFSKFYLRVQSKNCGKNGLFLFSFQNFFRILSENFSDFWPKNFKKFSKLPSTCPEEQFVAWIFFLKFWIVLDFLQKPSVWFSKFYLRVQSKNCGSNSFLIFLFRIFSDFEWNFFQTFGKKSSKSCQNYLLRVHRNNLWLYIFLKSFEPFWIIYRTIWHDSQNSIYVSWEKGPGKKFVFVFFSEFFFRILSENFSDFWPKNFKKMWKLPSACPEKQFVFWIFFQKFWIVSDFLRKPLAWFSKVYLRVQSKNCGRNSFCIFLFRIFSDFEWRIFQTFGQKTSRKCDNYLLRVQRNNL